MASSFLFIALSAAEFAPLWDLSGDELAARSVRRMVVDDHPGYPCRVSLEDAAIGEEVVLVPYTHHDVASPYRSSGPIFVRRGAVQARPRPGEVPAMMRHRLLSVRAYDAAAMMRGAEVIRGDSVHDAISRLLGDPGVAYLHIHNAGPGCFNCAVVRA